MKLEPLGKNQTRVIVQIPDEELNFTWDKDIYFSYGQARVDCELSQRNHPRKL